ncbi:hypothetical protein VTK56DRAFT_4773 [Thermocarpiscus australiensis]
MTESRRGVEALSPCGKWALSDTSSPSPVLSPLPATHAEIRNGIDKQVRTSGKVVTGRTTAGYVMRATTVGGYTTETSDRFSRVRYEMTLTNCFGYIHGSFVADAVLVPEHSAASKQPIHRDKMLSAALIRPVATVAACEAERSRGDSAVRGATGALTKTAVPRLLLLG